MSDGLTDEQRALVDAATSGTETVRETLRETLQDAFRGVEQEETL